MLLLLLIAIVAWIVLGAIGFVVKGLFWLFVIACVLFAITLVVSAFHGGRRGRRVTR